MNTLNRMKMILKECVKIVDEVDSYCNPNEISIDRIYTYHLLISYLFSIVSGAVMQETEVMSYNKQFMIMIIKHLPNVHIFVDSPSIRSGNFTWKVQ